MQRVFCIHANIHTETEVAQCHLTHHYHQCRVQMHRHSRNTFNSLLRFPLLPPFFFSLFSLKRRKSTAQLHEADITDILDETYSARCCLTLFFVIIHSSYRHHHQHHIEKYLSLVYWSNQFIYSPFPSPLLSSLFLFLSPFHLFRHRLPLHNNRRIDLHFYPHDLYLVLSFNLNLLVLISFPVFLHFYLSVSFITYPSLSFFLSSYLFFSYPSPFLCLSLSLFLTWFLHFHFASCWFVKFFWKCLYTRTLPVTLYAFHISTLSIYV